jgi:hypothetical protein
MAAVRTAILCGGIGSRLWPLSSPQRPKQFHALTGEGSLLRQTIERAMAIAGARRPIVVTDSVFSMDGDIAPLLRLAEVAASFDALLVVDDAHAVFAGCGADQLLGTTCEWLVVGTLCPLVDLLDRVSAVGGSGGVGRPRRREVTGGCCTHGGVALQCRSASPRP